MSPEMTEQVLGLTVNEVIAYAAALQAASAIVLAFITCYYAWYARRQADASIKQAAANLEQVTAANRQADAAQRTLDLLLNEKLQQRRIDISAVSYELEAAIAMIDDWLTRLSAVSYPQLPDVVDLHTAFSGSIANADRVNGSVAGYMRAGLLFISGAETNIRVLGGANPTGDWQQIRDKAVYNLNIARFKLDTAKNLLGPIAENSASQAQAA
jgi:hypothetical protein